MEFITEYSNYEDRKYTIEDAEEIAKILEPALKQLEERCTFENFDKDLKDRANRKAQVPDRLSEAYDSYITPNILDETRKEMIAESLGACMQYEFLKEHFGNDPEFLQSIEEGLWGWIKDTANDVWQGVKSAASWAWDKLKSLGEFGKAAYKLLLAITDGGSIPGIIHLVLDLIGFVDWWGPFPVGMIADLLNALIYFLYDKDMILGIISVAAAFFMDFLKPLKWALKPFSKFINKVFGFLTKKGGGKVGGKIAAQEYEQAAKAGAKKGGNPSKLKEFFNWVITGMAKVGGKVLDFASDFITSFNKGLQKYAVLDVLTKPIQWILKWVADGLKMLGRNMIDFADSYKATKKKIKELKTKTPDVPASDRFTKTKLVDDQGNPLYKDSVTGKTITKKEMDDLTKGVKKSDAAADAISQTTKKEVNSAVDELVDAGRMTKEEAKAVKKAHKAASEFGAEVTEEGSELVIKKGSKTTRVSKEKMGEAYAHVLKGNDEIAKFAKANPEAVMLNKAEKKARREVIEESFEKAEFVKNSDKLSKWKRSKFKRFLLLSGKYTYMYLNSLPENQEIPDEMVNDMADGVTDVMFKNEMAEQREEDNRLLSTEFDSFDTRMAETTTGYINTTLREQGLPQVHEWLYLQPDMEEYKEWFTETLPTEEIERLEDLRKQEEGAISESLSYVVDYDKFN